MPRPRLSPRRPFGWGVPFAALVLLLAAHATARAVPVAGLTAGNKIILFDSDAPGTVFVRTFVIGLRPGERVVGIDYRTSTAQLYAVGSSSRLYMVDPVTGRATQVGAAPFTPPLDPTPGLEFGVDFDPVSDKLRVVSDAGQSLLLDPDTGAAAPSPALVYAPGDANAGQTPSVTAIAYTNNFRGAAAKTLYGLDWRRNTLVRIGQPSTGVGEPPTGQTFTVGPLQTGFGVTELAGFDVAAADATAYAALRSTDALAGSVFYTVNLDTGAASQVGPVGGGEFVRDVTALSRPSGLFAVTASNKLLRFNSAAPGTIIDFYGIPPLQSPGERVVGLDCCPRGNEVVTLLTDASRFYNYNVNTSNLFFVGEILTSGRLSGNEFGFTFSPSGSRAVSDTGQNLVTNATTAVDGSPRTPLAYASGDPNSGIAPRVAGIAYEQKGAFSRMFDIDFNLDILARQVVPPGFDIANDTGQLFTVGPLGFDTTGAVGFDTTPGQFVITVNPNVLRDDGAFASLTAPGATTSGIFSVNLRTGRAAPLGPAPSSEVVTGLTVIPNVGLFRFSPGSYFVGEEDGSVTLTVTRSGDIGVEASVDFETFPSDVGATQVQDYTFASGTLRFAPGEASKTFDILITNDAHQDSGPNPFGESFTVFLRNPTAGFAIDPEVVSFAGTPGTASVLIEDDETPPDNGQPPPAPSNPIDETEFFVRQHYRDFLGREADAGGLAFWKGEIDGCGDDQQCREVKRENVSAAFFLSIEFQNTGYLVHRLYRAAFGRMPTYLEFMRGTREAAGGVVVGPPGWEARLALAKQAFVARFVARADFKQVFDPKGNAEYVDALFAGAGVAPGPAERQALVNGLDAGSETRATVLLKVAENEAFVRKEFSPAFVLAEYFGYLRRDADAGGFNFWLRKLEDNGGNFVHAQMVRAFIDSIEYRRRFAP
jgi:hypothetical protein